MRLYKNPVPRGGPVNEDSRGDQRHSGDSFQSDLYFIGITKILRRERWRIPNILPYSGKALQYGMNGARLIQA